MSGHKPWSEISANLRTDPERRARIEQREQAIEAGLTISQPSRTGILSEMKEGTRPIVMLRYSQHDNPAQESEIF